VTTAILDLLGALLTLLALSLLGLGGYLLSVRLLGSRAAEDPLELAVATLLAATGEALAIATLLGALGLLRIELGLVLAAVWAIALLRLPRRLAPEAVALPWTVLRQRAWAKVREHPALAILALHGIGSEALRGLLRPPLSWDSLMYHLLLTGTWLQDKNLVPVFGAYPTNYYGYAPANGSLWLWWWMAPSHSELYANLAFLSHWLLLALATGALARRLGARRLWPYAAFLVSLAPVIVRFAATQYVDVFTAACLLAAAIFGLRWMRQPSWGDAVLAGMGLGLAAGAKVIGIPYAGALAAAVVLLAMGHWRRRLPQLAAALLVMAALGSFFYVRNLALGVDPLAMKCESAPRHEGPKPVVRLPRKSSVLAEPGLMFGQGELLDSFLGITRPQSLEMGVGPQTFLLLAALLALPWGLARGRRREGLVVLAQVVAELGFWVTVPYAASHHVFANTRYLVPCFGIVFAAGIAMLEDRIRETWLAALAVALLAQDLLQMHSEMPHGVRVAMGVVDVLALILALSPGLRGFVMRRARELVLATAAVAILLAPVLGRFRLDDRERALAQEYQAHVTTSRLFASGWGWLDHHGEDGTVDVFTSPATYFTYPAMGQYLERKAIYVNVNPEDGREAAQYPLCQPRVHADPDAWLVNLKKAGVRWVLASRYPDFPYSIEHDWAVAHPELFKLRFHDNTNEVWEFLPGAPGAAGS